MLSFNSNTSKTINAIRNTPASIRARAREKLSEAVMRDQLAERLREQGWEVRTEVSLWGMRPQGRADLIAKRDGETRVVECKLRENWNAIGQVLRYTAIVDDSPIPSDNVKPTIMLGALCDVHYFCVCMRAGIDIWGPSMATTGRDQIPFRC